MKNKMIFTKKQMALFISVALHFITTVAYLTGTGENQFFFLPKGMAIFITGLWVIVDLVLVYRVAAELSSAKTK